MALPVVLAVEDHVELVVGNEATLAKKSGPQLNPDDAEDEEDEEAQQQDVPQHRQRVQQQHDQDPHA